MKKILLVCASLLSFITFSKFIDGTYSASLNKDNSVVEMSMIIKNNKIFSLSFDKKSIEGKSLKFSDKSFANEVRTISTQFRNTEGIDNIELNFDSKTNKEFKELYDFLIEKVKKGEKGNFEIK